MTLPSLSGPSVPTASGGPAKQLVVFLHGVGADGDDLIGLAPYFAERLPDAEFLSPHAPFPFDMAEGCRQWFSLQDTAPQSVLAGIKVAAPLLDAFLDQELAARGLTDEQLVVVGFSQGTMLALYVLLRRSRPCAVLVGFSGMLAAPDLLPAEMTVKPRILLIHGEDDPVVPHGFLPLAKNALELMGVPVLTLSLPDLGHGIDERGLDAATDLVGQVFGAEPSDQ